LRLRLRLGSSRGIWLAVGLAAMTDAHDSNFASAVVYLIDYAEVAHPDAPVAVRARQLPTAVRPRVAGQRPQRLNYPWENRGVEPPQAAFSGGFEEDGVHRLRDGRRGR